MSIPTLLFTQLLLAESSSCHSVGPGELAAIIALLGGLLTFALAVSAPAITMAIPAITIGIPTLVTKILAGLTIGASVTAITVPLDPLLDIAAVAAVVEGIKHILGCG